MCIWMEHKVHRVAYFKIVKPEYVSHNYELADQMT